MGAGRTFGLSLLGAVAGGATGGGLGLLAGLAYTSLADVSGFEGLSGYTVAFWILGGIVLGLILGTIAGAMLARRKGH